MIGSTSDTLTVSFSQHCNEDHTKMHWCKERSIAMERDVSSRTCVKHVPRRHAEFTKRQRSRRISSCCLLSHFLRQRISRFHSAVVESGIHPV
jgi:hypothetical protein